MVWMLRLKSRIFQVGIHPDDREKTAFSTSRDKFQFRVTPVGLANSPSTFERLMEDALRGLQWEECMLYMDDTIVPGYTVEESLCHLINIKTNKQSQNKNLKELRKY